MDCSEIRQRISRQLDGELAAGDEQALQMHLDGCAECRQDLEEQGALNMLLNKYLGLTPSEAYHDKFWPSVEQRLEDDPAAPAAGGGNSTSRQDELVFKSSPALKILNIPDRRPTGPQMVTPAADVPAPAAAAPKSGGGKWPLAFILGAAMAAGVFLVLKRLDPPREQAPTASEARIAAAPSAAASNEDEAKPETPAAGAADATVLASAAGTDGGTSATESADDDETAGGGVAANQAADDTADEKTQPGKSAARRPRGKRRSARSRRASKGRAADGKGPKAPAAAAAKPARASKPKRAGGGGNDLDSLIDGVIGAEKKVAKAAPRPTAAPASDLPQMLNMNQIRTGMRKIRGRIQACYDKFQIEGKATVRLTIKKNGAVSAAKVKGKFFGTDTGTCVAAAVKKARFPKFGGKDMTITYPFLLH